MYEVLRAGNNEQLAMLVPPLPHTHTFWYLPKVERETINNILESNTLLLKVKTALSFLFNRQPRPSYPGPRILSRRGREMSRVSFCITNHYKTEQLLICSEFIASSNPFRRIVSLSFLQNVLVYFKCF